MDIDLSSYRKIVESSKNNLLALRKQAEEEVDQKEIAKKEKALKRKREAIASDLYTITSRLASAAKKGQNCVTYRLYPMYFDANHQLIQGSVGDLLVQKLRDLDLAVEIETMISDKYNYIDDEFSENIEYFLNVSINV